MLADLGLVSNRSLRNVEWVFSLWTGCITLTKWGRVDAPDSPHDVLSGIFIWTLAWEPSESTGSGTGASWGPRHALHHYTSCVWLRNPQLRWPLSQPLSSRMQIRRSSAVLFIRHVTQRANSHVIDLTFTWVPVSLYWRNIQSREDVGFGRSGGVFPGCRRVML